MEIDLYAARTGNGFRAAIALEEAGLAYRAIEVNLREPRAAAYLALNPTGRIPTLVDHAHMPSLVISQTAAIILYVAHKTDRLLPDGEAARARALERDDGVHDRRHRPQLGGLFYEAGAG